MPNEPISNSGGIHKQNCRILVTKNLHETPFHDRKVTIWTNICVKTTIGSLFFSKKTISVSGEWLIMSVHKCVKNILVSTRLCAMPHCKSNNPVSAMKIPWKSEVKEGRHWLALQVSRFDPFALFFCGEFEKQSVHQQPSDHWKAHGKHSCWNYRYTTLDPGNGNENRSKKVTFCIHQ